MRKFAIFAGLGGSFGGAGFHGVYEYNDEADAERDDYMKAEEEYQSYEGCHGIMSWDECYEDAKEAGWFDESFSQNDIEDIVDTHYLEQIESWAEYYVREVRPETPDRVSEGEVEDWFLVKKGGK